MPSADAITSVDVTIREAQEADAAVLARLLAELGYPAKISFARKHIRRSQSPHSHSIILVAENKKAVVGFLAMHRSDVLPYPHAWLRITAMCVTADHRHEGIGRALETSAQQAAVNLNCSYIELTSDIRRTDAHRFYERRGYTEARKRYMKPVPHTAKK